MKTIPLCLNCKQPVDELSLCLEGDDVHHCQICKFTYTEKSELLPEGLRIWEENALGDKRNEHVWWSGHKSELCEKGQYVQTIRKGRGYHKKIEGQCRDCEAVYRYVGVLSFRHISGAWIIPAENRRFVWFPDCTHCRGGIENWYKGCNWISSCDRCMKRFELWVVENDQDNIKCHLSVKMYRFSDNLPRCQARSADQVSRICWRGIDSVALDANPCLTVQLRAILCLHKIMWLQKQSLRDMRHFMREILLI